MKHVTKQIVLSCAHPYGCQLPAQALGKALVAIPGLVRRSVDMVFRRKSAGPGKRPRWLKAVSEVSLVGIAGGEESILTFEAPTFGEAAPELFREAGLDRTNQPDPEDTGFDLFGDMLRDVARGNAESDRFDASLLSELWGTRKIFKRTYTELMIVSRRHGADDPTLLNLATLATAKRLHDATPRPQAVRIVGTLGATRDSTQTFAVMMDDEQEVRSVMGAEQIESLTRLSGLRVAVSGVGVFRPSGRFLCVQAESVREAALSDRIFAKIPRPNAQPFDLQRVLGEQGHKRGVAAIIGKWPGDETDEQLDRWLEESR
jgi:hypothetical protein